MVAAEGLDEEVEDTAALLATGGDDGENPLDEPAASLAVGPVARLPPAHRVANRTLRRVVRRLHTTPTGERPQARLDRQQLPAHRRRLRARAHGSAFQKNANFVRISAAGLRESHPHSISVTRESPNYPMSG